MKKFLVDLIALTAVLFASCTSTKFGGEKVPDWVITEPESTTADIYATGSGKNADLDMALKMAKADAIQTTDTTLKKADVVDCFQLKNGTVYVLMHMPLEQLD